MPLDPIVANLLEMSKGLPALTTLTPAEARQRMAERVAPLKGFAPGGVATNEVVIEGPGGELPIRLYRPEAASGALPVLLYFHGGGWVVGDLESHDGLCRNLALMGPLLVAAVDYRLAPETRSPGQQQDALAALRWAVASIAELGGDPAHISVGGDSAGGNLAALLAVAARDAGLSVASQLLIYPVTDTPSALRPSYTHNAEFGLSGADMDWFWAHWLGDSEASPETAPLRVETLSGVAPAYVVTAEFDVLHDEGRAYAEKLEDAGVSTELVNVPGMIHGFFNMAGMVPAATEAVQAAARWVASRGHPQTHAVERAEQDIGR